MKKITCILVTLLLLFSLAACSTGNNDNNTVTPPDNTQKPDNGNNDNATAINAVVVYFSATGTTKKIAMAIAEYTNAATFEITPTNPYTAADLRYNDSNSRVCKEHADESLRNVELTTTDVENWDKYDVVFVGYPIWWGISSWVVDSFVQAADFSDKTVVPFCTSASSPLGDSATLLVSKANGGNWLEGKRFGGNATQTEINTWVDGLQLATR